MKTKSSMGPHVRERRGRRRRRCQSGRRRCQSGRPSAKRGRRRPGRRGWCWADWRRRRGRRRRRRSLLSFQAKKPKRTEIENQPPSNRKKTNKKQKGNAEDAHPSQPCGFRRNRFFFQFSSIWFFFVESPRPSGPSDKVANFLCLLLQLQLNVSLMKKRRPFRVHGDLAATVYIKRKININKKTKKEQDKVFRSL